MKKFVFTINNEWLNSLEGDKSPLATLATAVVNAYPDSAKIVDKSANGFVCEFSVDKGVNCTVLVRIAVESLKDFPNFERSLVDVSVVREKAPEEPKEQTREEVAPETTEAHQSAADDLERIMQETLSGRAAVSSQPQEATSEKSATADDGAVEAVMEKIRGLITGADFKLFAEEIYQIAPQIRKNRTGEILLSQNYLVSIGDGCGLETYMELMRELFNSLHIPGVDLQDGTLFGKIPAKNDKAQGSLEDKYLQDFTRARRGCRIVVADISEWMNRVNGSEFHDVLQALVNLRRGDVLVFTVPFVDKEILENICVALNDIVFIRKMSFPPLTSEEINKFAAAAVEAYGFKMTDDAYAMLQRRIILEARDGRFHGIDTVNKVVNELLYVKQLSNVKNGSDSMEISGEDCAALCPADDSKDLTGMQMLENMVGTEGIKQKVLEIISQINLARKTSAMGTPCLHMRFLGNPGTGKTTVARIIGKILKENGILRIGEFHEHSGRDFCGQYIGETAPKTSGLCRDAYGSVLFIDEAYSLYRGGGDSKDYGREALDTLIAEMENHRDDLVVIMAGYTDDMAKLMEGNAGLQSRMPYALEFPNFTREQLGQIFEKMVVGKIECDPEVIRLAKEYFLGLDEAWVASKQFSNGRFVRNLFERCCAKAAMRCQLAGDSKISLTVDDFNRSIGDKEFLAEKKRQRIGFGG